MRGYCDHGGCAIPSSVRCLCCGGEFCDNHHPKHQPIPIPMLFWCPKCGRRHVDVGDFAAKPHHTHACQHCGMVWRPAIVPTVGVRFLPGFKDDAHDELVKQIKEDPPWQDV